MRLPIVAAVLAVLAAAQERPGVPDGAPPSTGGVSNVTYGSNGWPSGVGDATPAAPSGEVSPWARRSPPADATPADAAAPRAANPGVVPSGMDLASPLHDVFRATRSPGAFGELGGVVVWWRLTIHGAHGEPLGVREVKHTADTAFAMRDRLEHEDGRVFARLGEAVGAQRGGIPYDSWQKAASAELELFGMHLRVPWCYGDGQAYAIMRREAVEGRGEPTVRLLLERRPPTAREVFGPEVDPRPRDRFELLYEATTGRPRELVHRFASSGQRRRVLLEDWQERYGVRIPYRRIYVDEALRPTTTVEIKDIQLQRVTERDFRLL